MIAGSPQLTLEQLTLEEKRQVMLVVDVVEKAFPAIFLGLNAAQYRGFEEMYSPNSETKRIPTFSVLAFANGTGKTHSMILDMIGWTMGPEFLNWREFPKNAIEFYESITPLRNQGLLSLRLACIADDMKPQGSVYMLLKELFPWAEITGADNQKCYRIIEVPLPSDLKIKNTIGIKTFDQTEVKHSGNTCQRIWINEILPAGLVGETVGRIRAKDNRPDGTILNCATLLDSAEYVDELSDDEEMTLALVNGHIFENCRGEEVSDEMAQEVERTTGNKLKKAADGVGYITNGVLKLSSIQNQIKLWQKMCPDQVEARKAGSRLRSQGRIYVTYDALVHDVPNEMYEEIPENWPVVQIVDPHGAKPDFSAWALITPMNRIVFLDEWPGVDEFGYYENIDHRQYNIDQTCEIWRNKEVELGISRNIVARIGDPNRFREADPNNLQTLAYLYSMRGFNFYTSVNDNLELGHRTVHQYLYFDRLMHESNPNDPSATAHLLFKKRCENIRRSMLKYRKKRRRDRSEGVHETLVEEKYKHGADVVRYAAMWFDGKTFQQLTVDRNRCSDYEAWKRGHLPKSKRGAEVSFNTKGRTLVASGVY